MSLELKNKFIKTIERNYESTHNKKFPSIEEVARFILDKIEKEITENNIENKVFIFNINKHNEAFYLMNCFENYTEEDVEFYIARTYRIYIKIKYQCCAKAGKHNKLEYFPVYVIQVNLNK